MVDLTDLLPNAVVISVSMTGSTTSGQPLSEADLEQNQGYLINSELPPLVAAGKNPEYKMIMSPAEAAALTAAQQPQPRRADDRGGDDVALAVQRTSAENLPLGAGGAPWQGE